MEFSPGDRVTIPKGTVLTSTHPQYPTKTAGRDYEVTVNHTLSSVKLCVGHRGWDAEGNVKHEYFQYMSRNDRYTVEEVFGTQDLEALEDQMIEFNVAKRADGSSYCSLMLQVSEPQVRWAGTGGYWFSANLSDVTP